MSNTSIPENKKVGDPSPEAISYARRLIALLTIKWTKKTNVDIIAGTWQAGYTFGAIDKGKENQKEISRLQQENERLKEELSKEVGMAKINFKKYQDDIELIASLRKALERAIGVIYMECDDQKLINELNAVLNSTPTPVEQDDQNEKIWDDFFDAYNNALYERCIPSESIIANLKQHYHITKL